MIQSRAIRLVALFLILLGTAGCDQATKHFARTGFGRTTPAFLPGGLVELTLAENPGGFLSLGASLPLAARRVVLTAGVSVGLALLLGYVVRAPALRWMPFLGLALIWAGGISNLVDRLVRNGLVTDFIVLRFGPFQTGIFNLADLTIVAGVLILLVSLRPSPHHDLPPP